VALTIFIILQWHTNRKEFLPPSVNEKGNFRHASNT
jgi:hypothetical protein